jgi:small conductance mechanosensitive channel
MIRILKRKDLILSILNDNQKLLQTPHQKFFVKNLTDSAIEMAGAPGQPAKIMVLFSLKL